MYFQSINADAAVSAFFTVLDIFGETTFRPSNSTQNRAMTWRHVLLAAVRDWWQMYFDATTAYPVTTSINLEVLGGSYGMKEAETLPFQY